MITVITDRKTSNTKLNGLEQLKKLTTVVADTADFESIREFKPQDATTNPSLVYAATQKTNYSHFLEEVLVDRRNSGLGGAAQMEDIIDRLLVRFGCAMLEVVPGRVSTETDAASLSTCKVRSGKPNVWSSFMRKRESIASACSLRSLPHGKGSWRRSNCRRKASSAI
jgi:Transaldolase/Fructose-6-phosphate aldolase